MGQGCSCVRPAVEEDDGGSQTVLSDGEGALYNGDLYAVLFQQFANAVAIFRAEDGMLIEQNDASVRLLGPGVGTLAALFAGDPGALVDACRAVSASGVWRGLLPMAVLRSDDSHSASTRQHHAPTPQHTVSLAAHSHQQGNKAASCTAIKPQSFASPSGGHCIASRNAVCGNEEGRQVPNTMPPQKKSARLDMAAFLRGAGHQMLLGGPASDVADVAATAAAALKAVLLAARTSQAAKDAARVESEVAMVKGRRLARIALLAKADPRDDYSGSGANENGKRRTSIISAASVSLGADICLLTRETADSAAPSREGSLTGSPSRRAARTPSLLGFTAGLRTISRRLGSRRGSIDEGARTVRQVDGDSSLEHGGKAAGGVRLGSRPHSAVCLLATAEPNVKAKPMAAASPLWSYGRATRASRTVAERGPSGVQWPESSHGQGRRLCPPVGAGDEDADPQQGMLPSAIDLSPGSQSLMHSSHSEDPLNSLTNVLLPQSSSCSSKQQQLTSDAVPVVLSQQHSHAASGQANDQLMKFAASQGSTSRTFASSGRCAACPPPQAPQVPQSEEQLLEALTTSTWGMFLNLRSRQRAHDPNPAHFTSSSRVRALPLRAEHAKFRSFTVTHTRSQLAPPAGEEEARKKSIISSDSIDHMVPSIGHGSFSTPTPLAPVPEHRDNDGSHARLLAVRSPFGSVVTASDKGVTSREPAVFVSRSATECGQDETGSLTSTANEALPLHNSQCAREGLPSCSTSQIQRSKGSAPVVASTNSSSRVAVPRMSSLIYGRTSTTSVSAAPQSRSQSALPRLLSLAGRVSSIPSFSHRADSSCSSYYSSTAGQRAAAGTAGENNDRSAVRPSQPETRRSARQNESMELLRECSARKQLDGPNSCLQRHAAVSSILGSMSMPGRLKTPGMDSKTRDVRSIKGPNKAQASVVALTVSSITQDNLLPVIPTDCTAVEGPDADVPQLEQSRSSTAQWPVAATIIADPAAAVGSTPVAISPDHSYSPPSTVSSDLITQPAGVELAAGAHNIVPASEIEASIVGMAAQSMGGSILESYTLLPETPLTGAESAGVQAIPKHLQDQRSMAAVTAATEVESEPMQQQLALITSPQADTYCTTATAAADMKHLELGELVTASTSALGTICCSTDADERATAKSDSSGRGWPGQRIPKDNGRYQQQSTAAAPGQVMTASADLPAVALPHRPRTNDSTAGVVVEKGKIARASSCSLDRYSSSGLMTRQQQAEGMAAAEGMAPMERWHEVTVSGLVHPITGERLIMVLQNDVSARVWAERHLAMVVQAEHALLENIFPMHVIEHIAMMAVGAAASKKGLGSGSSSINTNDVGRHLAVTEDQAGQSGLLVEQSGLPDEVNTINIVKAPSAQPVQQGATDGGLYITGDTFLHLATSHSALTVLFCDIQGFTSMCNVVKPATVMAFLNDLYTRLDAMLDVYGVYKVETIGDCYVVAGGLMKVDEDTGTVTVRSDDVDPQHANRTVQFAKALLSVAASVHLPTTGQPVRLRVGIHSGPAMSGVVGTRMPRFCLFGDTINTASRVESTGVPGAIHVSQATRDLVPGEDWMPTGGVEAKGKGMMQTYLLHPKLHNAPTSRSK